jgi:heme-degrading monooxygenase HmoA
MRVVVFRSRLRAGVEERFDAHASAIYELAQRMPGFVSSKDFTAEDGERLTIIEFDSAEQLEAWRVQPDHQSAQLQGRAEYYEEYSLQVCELVRQSRFKRTAEPDA